MGNLSYFLGIEVVRTSQGLHLKQRKYITDLLEKADMLHPKPVATLLPTHPKLTLNCICTVLLQITGKQLNESFAISMQTSTLHAYSCAEWAGDSDDYVSTNAYLIFLGSQPVSWSTKKQKGVTRSSTEAEYRAVANTASELAG
ncbi:PREDICTED: uncharacterized mitochondrial protein AtMg00810-like [Brassica oleracea var. oleracea]|uniref:uncharacterized mitochondrial protein AtMg00810-like n=1 Tax=Brassica oleracea var. oleracea TaxID=109376 RepID=UPI0006A6C0F6|nr:PREDICTED: uncharacterized mitochondrial protein AtMg00810-like [Brassica oleracea var. oleracea]